MPSYSYRKAQVEKLIADADYTSLYLEVSFSEALKDGFVGGFLIALENAVEASNRRESKPTKADILRQQLYDELNPQEDLTIETVKSVLKKVGLTHKLKPESTPVFS
ncbi:MAG: transcriptional regulator [Cyanobacteria bacterium J06627_28]